MVREIFEAFVAVQQSGKTNMFDVKQVQELMFWEQDVTASRADIIECMQNYTKYMELYNVTI